MNVNLLTPVAKLLLGLLSVLPKKKEQDAISNSVQDSSSINDIDKIKKSEGDCSEETQEKLEKPIITNEKSTDQPNINRTSPTIESQTGKDNDLKERETLIRPITRTPPRPRNEVNAFSSPDYNKKLAIPLSYLGLSIRTYNCLRAAKITTLDKLREQSLENLFTIKGLEKEGLAELVIALKKFDYRLEDGGIKFKQAEGLDSNLPKSEKVNQKSKKGENSVYPEILEIMPKEGIRDKEIVLIEIKEAFDTYCKADETVIAFISKLKEISNNHKLGGYVNSCLTYIETSTNNFIKLYGKNYDDRLKARIELAVALIAKKKSESYVRNSKNSILLRAIASHCIPEEATGFHFLLRSLAGEKIYEIASTTKPRKQSGDLVRQKLGLASRDMLVDKKSFINELDNIIKIPKESTLIHFIAENGRLPCNEDFNKNQKTMQLYANISKLDLQERIDKIYSLDLQPETQEYDYHYEAIISGINNPGNDYWLELGNIAEFLKRHAAVLKQPYLMPKQSTLPLSVRGAITRFGGQQYVAKKVNLTFQGQLLGENRRANWTLEKIEELIKTIRDDKDQSDEWKPTISEVSHFLRTTDIEEFQDLKVESFITAIKKEGVKLPEHQKDYLYEFEINDNPSEPSPVLLNELIPQKPIQKNSTKTNINQFIVDERRADVLKGLDDSVRESLSEIFSENEEVEITNETKDTSNMSALTGNNLNTHAIGNSGIKEICELIKENIVDSEYISKSVLEKYSSLQNLMPGFVFDQINEIAIDNAGSLLIEEEDEERYYVCKDVLNSILDSLPIP